VRMMQIKGQNWEIELTLKKSQYCQYNDEGQRAGTGTICTCNAKGKG